MNRRRFLKATIKAILVLSLSLPSAATAQPSQKTFRIAWFQLYPSPSDTPKRNTEGLRRALQARGYIDGVNVVVDDRTTIGGDDVGEAVVADLLRSKPDIIVVRTARELPLVRKATKTIPIVFWSISDPVAFGFVSSLARPGGNITGPSYMGIELNVKRLELLIQVVPGARRIGVLGQSLHSLLARTVSDLRAASQRLNVELDVFEVHGREVGEEQVRVRGELEAAFASMAKNGARAVLVLQSPFWAKHREWIASLALKYRLASSFEQAIMVNAGGLMSYGADVADLMERAAYYVDRILKGANPGELPVEQSTKLQLVINMKTARALGLTIPPSVLVRAERTIE